MGNFWKGMGKIESARERHLAHERWLRVTDAAEMLGVSAKTLRRWEDAGRIRSHRSTGGHRRFAVADVRALQDELGGGPRVRPAPLPEGRLTNVADLLDRDGAELVRDARGRIYPPGRPGWFASRQAAAPVAGWQRRVAAACRTGAYGDALDASRTLWGVAMSDGYDVEPVECDAFVRLVGAGLVRALSDAGQDSAVPETRRLLAAIQRSLLEQLAPARRRRG